MRYLIDTNICIYIMNKRPIEVINRFKEHQVGEIGISTITLSELQFGVSKSAYPQKNQVRLDEFTAPFEIAPYDEIAARAYGLIRNQLKKSGRPIGPLDMLIAAHAVGHGLILVTNNEKEFRRIKELTVENWTR